MPRKKSEIAKALSSQARHPLGYQQCEWEAESQCLYPGSLSTNLHEGGPYYCREHFACKDPVWGATVVEASKDYRHIVPGSAEYLAQATRTAQEGLKASGMERRPGELFSIYRGRCMRFMREQFAGINKAA